MTLAPPCSQREVALIVDDHAGVRREIGSLLADSQYKVVYAAKGQDALTTLSRTAVDVVVTEIDLPKVAGLDLLVVMRRSYPALRLVLISSGARPGPLDEVPYVSALGNVERVQVLLKPFGTTELHAAIAATRPSVNAR